eukprot:11192593-Alexandrium_andersonii.AAC.1
MSERLGSVALCSLPGVHLAGIRIDLMHVLCLGVFHEILGSAFAELLRDNFWRLPTDGSQWQARFAEQLARAYTEFQEWARRTNTPHSEEPFTVARLSLPAMSAQPRFKDKAANSLK